MSGLGLVNAEQLVGALNGMGNNNPFNQGQMEMFQKALTVSSGYTGYNLEREVKFRLPAYTVLRNRVAVDPAPVGPMAGTAAVYKAQLGYNGFNFGAAMGTGFGQNGPEGNPNATQIAANYKSQSIKGSVQLEAIDMARMFTDPIKDQSMFNLQTLMRVEELLVTGGNEFAIDAPVPVGTQGTSGTGFANGTWTVKVTAITLEGALRNATSPYVPVLGVAAGESVPGTVSIVVSGGEKGFLNVSCLWLKARSAIRSTAPINTTTLRTSIYSILLPNLRTAMVMRLFLPKRDRSILVSIMSALLPRLLVPPLLPRAMGPQTITSLKATLRGQPKPPCTVPTFPVPVNVYLWIWTARALPLKRVVSRKSIRHYSAFGFSTTPRPL